LPRRTSSAWILWESPSKRRTSAEAKLADLLMCLDAGKGGREVASEHQPRSLRRFALRANHDIAGQNEMRRQRRRTRNPPRQSSRTSLCALTLERAGEKSQVAVCARRLRYCRRSASTGTSRTSASKPTTLCVACQSRHCRSKRDATGGRPPRQSSRTSLCALTLERAGEKSQVAVCARSARDAQPRRELREHQPRSLRRFALRANHDIAGQNVVVETEFAVLEVFAGEVGWIGCRKVVELEDLQRSSVYPPGRHNSPDQRTSTW
jgi:hypothetical protein